MDRIGERGVGAAGEGSVSFCELLSLSAGPIQTHMRASTNPAPRARLGARTCNRRCGQNNINAIIHPLDNTPIASIVPCFGRRSQHRGLLGLLSCM